MGSVPLSRPPRFQTPAHKGARLHAPSAPPRRPLGPRIPGTEGPLGLCPLASGGFDECGEPASGSPVGGVCSLVARKCFSLDLAHLGVFIITFLFHPPWDSVSAQLVLEEFSSGVWSDVLLPLLCLQSPFLARAAPGSIQCQL